jgi:hypothetical protein
MNCKFIYCTDIEVKNKLENKLELVSEQMIKGVKTWIFENDNTLKFNEIDLNKVEFTNKLFI